MKGIPINMSVFIDEDGIPGNFYGPGIVKRVLDEGAWYEVEGCWGTMEFPESRVRRFVMHPAKHGALPSGSEDRKGIPIASGVLDYFPAALAAVAAVSRAGNDKHNPGQPMHWARGKSMDQADCIARHLIDRGGIDPETGQRHSAQLAWRALALLQLELEEAGEAPLARGAREDA